jgi:hypothetical protein
MSSVFLFAYFSLTRWRGPARQSSCPFITVIGSSACPRALDARRTLRRASLFLCGRSRNQSNQRDL